MSSQYDTTEQNEFSKEYRIDMVHRRAYFAVEMLKYYITSKKDSFTSQDILILEGVGATLESLTNHNILEFHTMACAIGSLTEMMKTQGEYLTQNHADDMHGVTYPALALLDAATSALSAITLALIYALEERENDLD